ncbi:MULTISPECIES: hypothetical protein [Paraburkholderia]|uniref:Uncharacterized protein n=1 Tax=Paraburkholderia acidicola TaxID=1912599 RepID=A0ABV1LYM3_9BURK
MKLSRQTSTIGIKRSATDRSGDPLLPHEADQAPGSQEEHEPRRVGKQAHRDVERGLEDTDRRGGDDYQKRTQNDAQTSRHSGAKRKGNV